MIPVIIALIYGESSGIYFAVCGAACLVVGTHMTHKKSGNRSFFAKEGFVSVSLSWIVLSIIGALPFVLSGVIPNPVDAMFEIVSGFTTTGASILPEVESLPKCMLFWRSFSHWIGGMGVLVFILAILPLGGSSEVYLMSAESPGPKFGKLLPKLQKSAMTLYGIYLTMTVIEMLLLLAGGMSLFDSICTAFGTAGTGGFGVYNDSMGSFSPYLQNVVTIFMVLFGINFNFYFFLLVKEVREAFAMEEVRWYFIIYAVITILITLDLTRMAGGLLANLKDSSFQVATIMTTTGFATADFNNWPVFSQTILVLLMFMGACAGSTSGGVKVSRFIIYAKSIRKELEYQLHPRSIRKIKSDGKTMEHEVLRSTKAYLIMVLALLIVSVLIISLDGFDLVTNFTAVTSCMNDIGPGLSMVGPTGNYAAFSPLSKVVLMFDMLAGRLEMIPMLLLFTPATWRKQ